MEFQLLNMISVMWIHMEIFSFNVWDGTEGKAGSPKMSKFNIEKTKVFALKISFYWFFYVRTWHACGDHWLYHSNIIRYSSILAHQSPPVTRNWIVIKRDLYWTDLHRGLHWTQAPHTMFSPQCFFCSLWLLAEKLDRSLCTDSVLDRVWRLSLAVTLHHLSSLRSLGSLLLLIELLDGLDLLLQLHPPVLEPNFNLSLRQTELVSHLYPSPPGEVVVGVELLL